MVFSIKGRTLPEGYHNAIMFLEQFGEERYNKAWGQKRKEITALIEIDAPLEEPRISRLGIYGARDLRKYEYELLDGAEDFELEAGNWTYTYHDRMACQVEKAIELLKEDPGTTRAILTIRNQSDIIMTDSPCMVAIQFMVMDGKLNCYVTFRSNDLVQATFMNAWGLTRLQERVAEKIGVPVGKYVHYAVSMHCYEKDFARLKSYSDRIFNECENTYFYEGDWKDEMEDEEEGILKELEELRLRTIGR